MAALSAAPRTICVVAPVEASERLGSFAEGFTGGMLSEGAGGSGGVVLWVVAGGVVLVVEVDGAGVEVVADGVGVVVTAGVGDVVAVVVGVEGVVVVTTGVGVVVTTGVGVVVVTVGVGVVVTAGVGVVVVLSSVEPPPSAVITALPLRTTPFTEALFLKVADFPTIAGFLILVS